MSVPVIRPSTDADIAAITAIYASEVREGFASFELKPPDDAEMAQRRAAVLAMGLPHLVAEMDGRTVGYAYAGTYRTRPAYRFTVENAIYVAADARGRGVARALMERVIELSAKAGMRRMVAVISASPDGTIGAASIRLHAALGFEHAGTLPGAGWKHGRWIDTVRMQRALGEGDATPPV